MNLKEINEAKHIVIETDSDSFANATAIYSYILTLHKKVSLRKTTDIDVNLSFLPWYDKVRDTIASSADLKIVATSDSRSLFELFKSNNISINKKMATSLYTGIMLRYKNFLSDDCDGTIFAISSELISLNAEYKTCTNFLTKRVPLSLFRLKAIMFKNLLLKEDAKEAHVYVAESDLRASGTSLKDAISIANEISNLVNVEKVILYERDENKNIIKILKEI
ncbi:phosphoesterase [Sulfurimonas aquatica]|uniref:Phosphoesterase n=1 Tax=Sulfurimonas aquatica TaxID=2672570 RepID=A0A975GC97_9BACT|nr:phosphoesterase [Sulfurimonas aquatica]QSZ41287.1 phosphoesterase [Sulfurimonas aquatica]